ncbi:HNH endonuclease [Microcoleus sp. AT3-D2]|uniref:HNH endonuclease n=1 Tax=Microcoleus sp. AT3-D2 TaxID=2818612 RepID=UPI002FD3AE32
MENKTTAFVVRRGFWSMRCIFCKSDSSKSKSVEHIIPESLGNTTKVLPKGIVCDTCNNYFARKVEQPFLEAPALKALRFHQVVPNKRQRVPPLAGIFSSEFSVTAYRYSETPLLGLVDMPPEAIKVLFEKNGGEIIFSGHDEPPPDRIVSRFLAKVALELMGLGILEACKEIDDLNASDGIDYLVNEAQLDLLRNHARRGDTPNWPYNSRRIYKPNEKWIDEFGSDVQIVHESDILQTSWGEWFCVLAIFGLELVINCGGPEIEGYHRWLSENNGDSPLYSGKNKCDRRSCRVR